MVPVRAYDFDLIYWPSLFLAVYCVYQRAPKDWRYRRYPAIFVLFFLFSIIIAGFIFTLRYLQI